MFKLFSQLLKLWSKPVDLFFKIRKANIGPPWLFYSLFICLYLGPVCHRAEMVKTWLLFNTCYLHVRDMHAPGFANLYKMLHCCQFSITRRLCNKTTKCRKSLRFNKVRGNREVRRQSGVTHSFVYFQYFQCNLLMC